MVFNRLSGRKGAVVRLNMSFYRSGVLTDPYAIRRIDIYRTSRSEDNLVTSIVISDPDSSTYPYPISREPSSQSGVQYETGLYYYDFSVPDDFVAPEVYLDDWLFIGDELINSSGSSVIDDETLWDNQCGKFWIITGEGWYADDGLIIPRFGFEPIDIKFIKPEVRSLEVGIVPLPLYDYDCNLVSSIMPYLTATLTVTTAGNSCETIIDNAPMTLGLRQGSFRTSPFVARYLLDTSSYQSGTYRYNVTLNLPNGETRVSPSAHLTISTR